MSCEQLFLMGMGAVGGFFTIGGFWATENRWRLLIWGFFLVLWIGGVYGINELAKQSM